MYAVRGFEVVTLYLRRGMVLGLLWASCWSVGIEIKDVPWFRGVVWGMCMRRMLISAFQRRSWFNVTILSRGSSSDILLRIAYGYILHHPVKYCHFLKGTTVHKKNRIFYAAHPLGQSL